MANNVVCPAIDLLVFLVHVLTFVHLRAVSSLRPPKKAKKSKSAVSADKRGTFFDTLVKRQKARAFANAAFGQSLKAAAAATSARSAASRGAPGKELEAWLVDAPNTVGSVHQAQTRRLFACANGQRSCHRSFLCLSLCVLTATFLCNRCGTGATNPCESAKRTLKPAVLMPARAWVQFTHRWIGWMTWRNSKIHRVGWDPPQPWTRIILRLP